MVAVELLNGESADDVPVLVLIVHVAHQSVSVLCKSLLAHEVGLFQRGTVCERIVIQSEFLQFVVQSELLVVAVAVGVVERGRGAPVVVDIPGCRQDVVILPEVVGGLVPQRAVGHGVALGDVVAVGVFHEVAVGIVGQGFVEGVVFAESDFVKVFIVLDAGLYPVGAIHQTHVVVARRNAVPGLSGLLEVSDILIADGELVVNPSQSAIVRTGAAACAVDITVGVGLVVGTVEDQMVPKQTGGECTAHVERVVGTVGEVHLTAGFLRRRLRREGHRSAKGAVAIGTRSHAALNLHTAQQRTVGVHIGPEHGLVFR